MSKIKLVAAHGHVELYDSLQMLGAPPMDVSAAPLPTGKSNITEKMREEWRQSSLPTALPKR